MDGWRDVAGWDDLAPGTPLEIVVDEDPVMLVRVDDRVFALDALCTHEDRDLASGRLAEDGGIPGHYQVAELPGSGYRQRTRQNVIDSDGTLIVNLGVLEGRTLETCKFAEQLGKPCLLIQAEASQRAAQAESLDRWLHTHRIVTLNVAGPRASKRRDIYNATRTLLDAWLGNRIEGEEAPASSASGSEIEPDVS